MVLFWTLVWAMYCRPLMVLWQSVCVWWPVSLAHDPQYFIDRSPTDRYPVLVEIIIGDWANLCMHIAHISWTGAKASRSLSNSSWFWPLSSFSFLFSSTRSDSFSISGAKDSLAKCCCFSGLEFLVEWEAADMMSNALIAGIPQMITHTHVHAHIHTQNVCECIHDFNVVKSNYSTTALFILAPVAWHTQTIDSASTSRVTSLCSMSLSQAYLPRIQISITSFPFLRWCHW